MGCTASKLDNEKTVWLCKERRRLMKEAVSAFHLLAAAHADYLCSLRRTGSALSSFAGGKSLSARTGSSEAEREREETQSTDTGDYRSTRSSPKEEGGMGDEDGDETMDLDRSMPPLAAGSEVSGSSAASYRTGEMPLDKMKEIVDDIVLKFDAADKAGRKSLEMLNIKRDRLDWNFSQQEKTVHGPQSLSSTLERLLAWENKLYKDVKTRKGMGIEHEKLSTLQSKEKEWEDQVNLDLKTEAPILRLQSEIFVTSQIVSTSSDAIIGLRDSHLVRQLSELCCRLRDMWRSMNQCHEEQKKLVRQVSRLVNPATRGDWMFELHWQATRDLESAVTAWRSSFCRLIKFQRDFIRSLHGWFNLSLTSVTTENINGSGETSGAYDLCEKWKDALESFPDKVASGGIKSFIDVVHVISVKQTEELKMKKRSEIASKKLEKKASFLRKIEKLYSSYFRAEVRLSGVVPDNGQAVDACYQLLTDLLTGLRALFKASTDFSASFAKELQICTHSHPIE